MLRALQVVGALALAVPAVHAALNPWEVLDPSTFRLSEFGYDPEIADLDRVLASNRSSVDAVIADGNHQLVRNNAGGAGAWQWPQTADWNDFDKKDWIPQGISSSADALAKGVYGTSRVMLVSWYYNGTDPDKGVRIAFIDRTARPWTYRYVLLVQPIDVINTRRSRRQDPEPTFTAAPVHAGGIMWYGNMLYVVDTEGGLRLFDMDHIYRVDDTSTNAGKQIGRGKKGVYHAYGYKYVLPQVRTYSNLATPAGEPFRFSYLALDRTTTPDSMVVGEYATAADEARVARFDLDSTTRLLKPNAADGSGDATPTEFYRHGYTSIQGTASANGTYYLTMSHGKSVRGDLYEYTQGDFCYGTTSTRRRRHLVRRGLCALTLRQQYKVQGPEDLSVDRKGKNIWTVSEWAGHRFCHSGAARSSGPFGMRARTSLGRRCNMD